MTTPVDQSPFLPPPGEHRNSGSFSSSTSGRVPIVVVVLMAIALGVLLGTILGVSGDALELTITILVFALLTVLVVYKPLIGLLAWILLMAFIDNSIMVPMGSGIPNLSFSRYVIILLLAVMFVRAIEGRFRFQSFTITDLLVITVPLAMLITTPQATEPLPTAVQIITLQFVPLMAFFFAKHLVRGKRDIHQLVVVIVIFGLLAAVYAIFEVTTGRVLFQIGSEVSSVYRAGTDLRLINGLMGNTGSMARVLALTIIVTVFVYDQSKDNVMQVLLLGMIAVQMAALFVTYSRTPIVALMIALLLLQFFYVRFRMVFLVILVVALLALGFGWERFQNSSLAEDRINYRADDLNGRTPRWQAGAAMWAEKPLLGWGFGRFEELSGQYRTDESQKNLVAVENDYLLILLGSGLTGFLPYLLFLLIPFIKSIDLYRRSRSPDWPGFVTPAMIVAYWAVLVCFLIFSFTAKNNHALIKMVPFVMAGAVVGSQEYLLKKPPHNIKTAEL